MAYCSGYFTMQQENRQNKDNLVQVPSSTEDCTNLFMQCLSEPNSEKKKQQEHLLQFIEKATEKNRHPFQTFVMLLGNTGAGKSSTINHLMNCEMILTSNRSSETRTVTEYSKTCAVPELGLKGLRMNIVDTPGFGDTDGPQQDACNLCAIKKFCSEYLHTAKILAQPNIILLCMEATEKRFDGAKSSLVKNLQILEAMRVIDRENPNVVLVLTNACSVARKNWAAKISETAKNINQVLKSRLGFCAKIAYIENDLENHELPGKDEGTLLPDDTVQPANLFLTIMEQLEINGDELGHSTFRQIYSDGVRKQNFKPGNSVQAKIMSKEGNRMDKDENQCFLILQDVSGAAEGLNDLIAEYERLHEENKKSKKLQAEQEQILKNVIEATKQKEIQTQEDLRRREERLEQSFEKREELSREDMRRQKESFERRLKDLEEQSNHDREKAKEEEKKREEEMEKMRSKTAEDQKKMDDLHKQLREKELQVIPVQQPQLTTTPTSSREKTAKKTGFFKRRVKPVLERGMNLARNGLVSLASRVAPSVIRPALQAITAGK